MLHDTGDQFQGTVAEVFIFYLDIWHYIHSAALTSPSYLDSRLYFFYPSLYFFYPSLFLYAIFIVLQPVVPLLVFLKITPESVKLSDLFVFPLPQWARCSLEWQGLFMTKVFSRPVCPQREAQLQGQLCSGCQTQLPLAVTSSMCVTVVFSGPLQHGEKPFVIHHVIVNPCSLTFLFSKQLSKHESGNIPLFISDQNVLFNNSNVVF